MSGRRVLLVDWLGRGGIAHCSRAWVDSLRASGADVALATRDSRELAAEVSPAIAVRTGRAGAAVAHLELVARVARSIGRLAPELVVVQNFAVPDAERAVVRAAHRSGVPVVLVAHESEARRARAGGPRALANLLREVDVVVVHSDYVGGHVAALSGRTDVVRVPLPLAVGLLAGAGGASPLVPSGDGPLALHFGHLHREYKGTGVFAAVTATPLPPWRFAVVGRGASRAAAGSGAALVDRFVGGAELAATVAASQATVLPYSRASQSGAVVLAQALGSVVLASRVGGLAEQVSDRVSGFLLDPAAPVAAWRELLASIAAPAVREPIAAEARRRVHEDHEEFARYVASLVAGSS